MCARFISNILSTGGNGAGGSVAQDAAASTAAASKPAAAAAPAAPTVAGPAGSRAASFKLFDGDTDAEFRSDGDLAAGISGVVGNPYGDGGGDKSKKKKRAAVPGLGL